MEGTTAPMAFLWPRRRHALAGLTGQIGAIDVHLRLRQTTGHTREGPGSVRTGYGDDLSDA